MAFNGKVVEDVTALLGAMKTPCPKLDSGIMLTLVIAAMTPCNFPQGRQGVLVRDAEGREVASGYGGAIRNDVPCTKVGCKKERSRRSGCPDPVCAGIKPMHAALVNIDSARLMDGGTVFCSHYPDKAEIMDMAQANVREIYYYDESTATEDAQRYVETDVRTKGIGFQRYQSSDDQWATAMEDLAKLLSLLNRPLDFVTAGLLLASINASRTKCLKIKAGTFFFDVDEGILGGGYNGPARGTPNCFDVGCNKHASPPGRCRGCHAERNCFTNTSRAALLKHGTVFMTVFPCIDCANIVFHRQPRRLYCLGPYKKNPSVGVTKTDERPEVIALANRTGVEVYQLIDGKMELVAGPLRKRLAHCLAPR